MSGCAYTLRSSELWSPSKSITAWHILISTSPVTGALLFVSKPGLAKFKFTVDLRPVRRFTVRHQFPMPNL